MRAHKCFGLTKQWVDTAANWLLPPKCLICEQKLQYTNEFVCNTCYYRLPHRHNCCRRCGQSYSVNFDYCGQCIASPPPYEACFCAFEYEQHIARLIRKFKYFECPELAEALAQLVYLEIAQYQIELPDLLIPVPMHDKKLRKRGFNQSLLLTKAISKLANIPYSPDLIVKSKATPAQADLSLYQRRKNLKGSFKANKKTNAKHVVIVDDVVTTGSTAAEITKILKRNGVDYVQIWGIAQRV